MTGILNLEDLLVSMAPELDTDEYVFSSVQGQLLEYAHLSPIGSFVEAEGLTLIIPRATAQSAELNYDGVFKRITLSVHSSLEAVGLTAAIAETLTQHGISANVVAAYYHDHVFVQKERAQDALHALHTLIENSRKRHNNKSQHT